MQLLVCAAACDYCLLSVFLCASRPLLYLVVLRGVRFADVVVKPLGTRWVRKWVKTSFVAKAL